MQNNDFYNLCFSSLSPDLAVTDERKSGAKVGKTRGSHGSTYFFTGVGTMKKQIQLARIKD